MITRHLHPSILLRLSNITYFMVCAALCLVITIANECAHKGVVVAYLNPPLTTASSSRDVVIEFGQCDPSSYIKEAGILLAGVDPRKQVFIKVWAPGFPVVEAGVLKLSPQHFVRNMFVLTALVWAAAIGLCCVALREISGSSLFPLLLLLVLATQLFGDYLLNEGVLYSETLGTAIFMPSMIWFCAGWARNSTRQVLTATCGLIACGFLRTQFLLVSEFVLSVTAAYTVVLVLLHRYGRIATRFRSAPALIAVVSLVASVNAYAAWNDGEFVHNEFIYSMVWRVPPPDMFDTGGLGVLCQSDGKTCDRMRLVNAEFAKAAKKTSDFKALEKANEIENKRAVMHTLLTRPLRIIWLKLHYFARYFLSAPLSVPEPVNGFTYLYMENILFGLFGVAALAGCVVFRRIWFFQALGLCFVCGAVGSCLASLTIIHFEVRYLVFAKALDCVTFAVVLAHVCRLAREKGDARPNRLFAYDESVP